MVKKEQLQLGVGIALILIVLGSLGINIATLVKVLNEKVENVENVENVDKKEQSTTPPPPEPAKEKHLNIRDPEQISGGHEHYRGYKEAVDYIRTSLNTSVNPCDDFYKYACGNFKYPSAFAMAAISSQEASFAQINDKKYIEKAPKPVKQMAYYYNKCSDAMMHFTDLVKDGKIVMDAINRIAQGEEQRKDETQFPFYMLYQNESDKGFPTPRGLGYLLGFPSATDFVNTLIPVSVSTNYKDPQGRRGYQMYFEEPRTLLPYTYHVKLWKNMEGQLVQEVMEFMLLLARTQNITLNKGQLFTDARSIVKFDHLLALNFGVEPEKSRQFERTYNPMTMRELNQRYPQMSWFMFTAMASSASRVAIQYLHSTSEFNYIVAEPEILDKLLKSIGDPSFVSARTLVNYVYFKLANSYSDFLPWGLQNSKIKRRFLAERPWDRRDRRRLPIWEEPRGYERKQYADEVQAQRNCAGEAFGMMTYAGARAFIDKIYPTEESRRMVREEVGNMLSGILVGFRSMIDQLNWMTPAAKQSAYTKIDNIVKNIAYPDWITDDELLEKYYDNLNIDMENDDYLTMVAKIRKFEAVRSIETLLEGPVDRSDFSGSSATVNAWYQFTTNAITMPAAILSKPVFDLSFPRSMNYGAIGVILGHELSHGFDDMGVQWDSIGALNEWMDEKSKEGFNKMAKCVVDEYSNFCPLDKSKYGDAACIDGVMTQGENIADNGGIGAAYRAYRNSISLKGPDPQLPDDLLDEFTHDQLFFLSFAKVWCRPPGPISTQLSRLLTDPHSPAAYRVLGTLQNFPAFKEAFHCPSSIYAPDKHCNVWVSEMDTAHGIPVVKTELNIEKPKMLTPNEKANYAAAKVAIDFFQASVNTSVDPCDDFYQYACGNYQKPVSFHFADAKNLLTMANQLMDSDYQNIIKHSTALTKEKAFFDACVNATSDSYFKQQILVAKNYLKPRVDTLAGYLGADFTYALGGSVEKLPNSTQLANALAYLSFDQNIHTLVSPMVDTNWPEPTKGYAMFLDQNTAYMSKTFYHPDAFKTIKEKYVETATKVIETFVVAQNRLADLKLKDKVRGLVEFEQMIANNYSTDDTTRRMFARSWNLMKIDDVQQKYNFINWKAYMAKVPKVAQGKIQDRNFKVSVMEPEQYEKMSRGYADFDKEKLVNYLFMRLLLSNAQYLPSFANIMEKMPEEPVILGKRRRNIHFSKAETPEDIMSNCAHLANELMMYANGRVFIDYLYPDERSREIIRDSAGGVMLNVIHAFQGMVNSLDWMSEETKKKAIEKSQGIEQNTAYPDWILNNNKLDEYYKNVVFNPLEENFYDMWTKLTQFNIEVYYKQLTATKADRKDFLLPPGIVNAWYIPELNSITFPAGILRPPYFHPEWPASIKYGAMGVVAGHELIHGFDDQGVQWGADGEISFPKEDSNIGWMDRQSTAGFNSMARCVINEYEEFCPLSESFTPNCVNGKQTQGENIADNGGIHAAYRAYRSHVALKGPDPQLPDRLFGQYTHDQLFFLSFAQVWCEKRRVDEKLYQQLMVDPHAPAMYRVFGTLQNYPAFRAAYNCPLNSRYSPRNHCKVWVPNRVP